MRPPRHAAIRLHPCGPERAEAAHELQEEPETDEHDGWNARREPNNEQRNERENAARRKEKNISAENAGDCAASADCRYSRAPTECRLRDSRADSTNQIEPEIRKMAEAIFDVAAKNPEEPHVADNVQPAAMQKHRGKKRHNCINDGQTVLPGKCELQLPRHHAVMNDEKLRHVLVERKLKEEHQKIYDDETNSHAGKRIERIEILQRNHEAFALTGTLTRSRGLLQILRAIPRFVTLAGANEMFDFVESSNRAARANPSTRDSRRRATEFEIPFDAHPSDDSIYKRAMKNIPSAGRINRVHLKRRRIEETLSIPADHSVTAKIRGHQATLELGLNLAQCFKDVSLVGQPRGECARGDEIIHILK